MNIASTQINDLYIIKIDKFTDKRGFFKSLIDNQTLKDLGIKKIDQSCISLSKKGVFRGLHYQIKKPLVQLVYCAQGDVLDVLCDMRKNSKSFGKTIKIRLNENDNKVIFIPKGLAHGFLSLHPKSLLIYNIIGTYDKILERGVNYKSLNLNLPLKPNIMIDRDKNWPNFLDADYI